LSLLLEIFHWKIYNTRGQVVRTLANGSFEAGIHNLTWDAANDYGVKVASGLYFYQLVAKDFKQVKKMILMK
jgi:flagellar hook assembly protein FlgD